MILLNSDINISVNADFKNMVRKKFIILVCPSELNVEDVLK